MDLGCTDPEARDRHLALGARVTAALEYWTVLTDGGHHRIVPAAGRFFAALGDYLHEERPGGGHGPGVHGAEGTAARPAAVGRRARRPCLLQPRPGLARRAAVPAPLRGDRGRPRSMLSVVVFAAHTGPRRSGGRGPATEYSQPVAMREQCRMEHRRSQERGYEQPAPAGHQRDHAGRFRACRRRRGVRSPVPPWLRQGCCHRRRRVPRRVAHAGRCAPTRALLRLIPAQLAEITPPARARRDDDRAWRSGSATPRRHWR